MNRRRFLAAPLALVLPLPKARATTVIELPMKPGKRFSEEDVWAASAAISAGLASASRLCPKCLGVRSCTATGCSASSAPTIRPRTRTLRAASAEPAGLHLSPKQPPT